MEFNSLDELYKKVLPALEIKAQEYCNIVTPRDIWDYLSKMVWPKTHDLTLAKIVDDILKCDVSKIKILRGEDYDK